MNPGTFTFSHVFTRTYLNVLVLGCKKVSSSFVFQGGVRLSCSQPLMVTTGQVSVLSESMVIIVIGYLLGIILPTHGGSVIAWAIGDVGVEEEGLAMAGVLNLFLLPIIIFEAGWSMNHRAFVDLLPLGPRSRLLRISQS